jgi:hypothetical protein
MSNKYRKHYNIGGGGTAASSSYIEKELYGPTEEIQGEEKFCFISPVSGRIANVCCYAEPATSTVSIVFYNNGVSFETIDMETTDTSNYTGKIYKSSNLTNVGTIPGDEFKVVITQTGEDAYGLGKAKGLVVGFVLDEYIPPS